MKLFTALPAELAALTDEELAALTQSHVDALSKIKANDPEFLGDASATEVIAELKAGREQYNALKAEQAARVEAQTNFQAEVDALTSDVEELAPADAVAETVEDPDPADPADPEAPEADEPQLVADPEPEPEAVVEEPELVTAAAAPVRFARPPRVTAQHAPVVTETGVALIASGGIEGIPAGTRLDRMKTAEALIAVREASSVSMAGIRENVVVASAKEQFAPEFTLVPGQGWENTEKIKAIVGEQALVASGGLCAPRTPLYDLPNISVANRPVRDSLPSFQAVRGGIQFAAPPTLADITNAVGVITEAQDAAGGSSGAKTCQTVVCPEFSTVDVNAIFACISAGNLGARAYPEQVAQFLELVDAAHARTAETKLLDLMSAGSVQATTTAIAGATASLFPAMLAAGASIRSHFRMSPDAVLRLLVPAYAKDLLKADIVRQPFDKFQLSDAELLATIRSFNLEPSFYMDGETGGGQVFASQAGGALNSWPTAVKWFIFPEGTWLHLDGGTLNLGIVRDSTLNATNTYQIFREDWESVAKVGVVSYEVTSTIWDNGQLSAPATITNPAY